MSKKSVLTILVILASGLIGTTLSSLYQQNEFIGDPPFGTVKESYGFPLGWYGYSRTIGIMPVSHPEMVYWFSLESFLLDTALWLAISSLACVAAVKSGNILRKTRGSKIQSGITVGSLE